MEEFTGGSQRILFSSKRGIYQQFWTEDHPVRLNFDTKGKKNFPICLRIVWKVSDYMKDKLNVCRKELNSQ